MKRRKEEREKEECFVRIRTAHSVFSGAYFLIFSTGSKSYTCNMYRYVSAIVSLLFISVFLSPQNPRSSECTHTHSYFFSLQRGVSQLCPFLLSYRRDSFSASFSQSLLSRHPHTTLSIFRSSVSQSVLFCFLRRFHLLSCFSSGDAQRQVSS